MWQDELREKLKPAIKQDGWGFEIIEADAEGLIKILEGFIASLLKEQIGKAEERGFRFGCELALSKKY